MKAVVLNRLADMKGRRSVVADLGSESGNRYDEGGGD